MYRPATHPIILPSVSPDKILRLYCVGGIFFLGKPYLENFMSRPSVIPAFRPTPLQNRDPSVLNHSRKRRIAAGAGVKVEQINQLLKQFDMMNQMVKQFSGPGASKKMKRMGKFGGMGGFPGGFPGM